MRYTCKLYSIFVEHGGGAMAARAGAQVGRRGALPLPPAARARIPVRRGEQPLGRRNSGRASATRRSGRARQAFLPRPQDAALSQSNLDENKRT